MIAVTKFCNSQRKCFLIIKVMRIRIIPLDDDKTRINTKINSSLDTGSRGLESEFLSTAMTLTVSLIIFHPLLFIPSLSISTMETGETLALMELLVQWTHCLFANSLTCRRPPLSSGLSSLCSNT